MAGPSLLEVSQLEMHFGAVKALAGVDLAVRQGEFVGIIGANGSGKTTLFNCVTGFLKPTRGRILFERRDITGHKPHGIARAGVGRTFQQPMVFPSGTVRQNVEMALSIAGSPDDRRAPGERIDELLDQVSLLDVRERAAALLPYGKLRQLGVALALAARPRLLLLDEPAAGLNDAEASVFGQLLTRISTSGVTLCVVDHDMEFLLPLVHRLVVLDAGSLLADGPAAAVQREPQVVEAYLGSRFATGGSNLRERRRTAAPQSSEILRVTDLRASYGAIEAVSGVDLVVRAGESVAILGPNGAGKTTLMRAISHLMPSTGRIELDGKLVSGGADVVARLGVAHVLENRHIFRQLTVAENLRVPRLARRAPGFDEDLIQVLDMFPLLKPRLKSLGGQLSGGQQQALAIARALLMRPRLLLMDEPSLGLAPIVVDQLAESIKSLRERWQVGLLIAEQSLSLVMEAADRYYLLRRGKVAHSGDLGTAVSSEEILRAYLGSHEDGLKPEPQSRVSSST